MKELKDIIDELKDIDQKYQDEINNVYHASYSQGHKDGVKFGTKIKEDLKELQQTDSKLDYNSIRIFAAWCYICGIDFSYMSKANETKPFIDRVIEKFEAEVKEFDLDKD